MLKVWVVMVLRRVVVVAVVSLGGLSCWDWDWNRNCDGRTEVRRFARDINGFISWGSLLSGCSFSCCCAGSILVVDAGCGSDSNSDLMAVMSGIILLLLGFSLVSISTSASVSGIIVSVFMRDMEDD